MNLVCAAIGTETTIKLIDFDASARYGEMCHLKFSSAFAPPQLAAELLRYETTTGSKPADAPKPPWAPWDEWVQSRGILTASVAKDIWAFGILAFKMCAEDGASMFLSSEADNIVRRTDLEMLAYFWNRHSQEEVARVVWSDAADMILKCLQATEASRPESFAQLLQHPFFDQQDEEIQAEAQVSSMDRPSLSQADEVMQADPSIRVADNSGRLYFPESVTVREQNFHSAIESGPLEAVVNQLKAGGVHLMLVDESRSSQGERATPLMRAAFAGNVMIAKALLGEIDDSWPDEVRKEYLDQRTSLDFTAFMIACARGHEEIAELLKKKGCDAFLVNSSGESGAALLKANPGVDEDSTVKSLESYLALLDQKVVVMSCPEMGTLKPDGSGPFEEKVMDKVSELVKRGVVKLGFDRAGTSTAVKTEEENRKWSMAEGTIEITQVVDAMRSLGLDSTEVELQDLISKLKVNTNGFTVKSDSGTEETILANTIGFLDYAKVACELNKNKGEVKLFSDEYLKAQFWEFACATPEDVKKQIFKLTEWWNGYQSSVKAIVKTESQGFGGTLNVTCIEGGPITQLEAAEMPRIMNEAKGDCSMSGIAVRYQITKMSYCDFLAKYEHEPGDRRQAHEVTNYEVGDNARPDVHAQLAEARAQLAAAHAKDEELASVVAAKDEELKQLRAQLERLEGVPPQRPDKDVQ